MTCNAKSKCLIRKMFKLCVHVHIFFLFLRLHISIDCWCGETPGPRFCATLRSKVSFKLQLNCKSRPGFDKKKTIMRKLWCLFVQRCACQYETNNIHQITFSSRLGLYYSLTLARCAQLSLLWRFRLVHLLFEFQVN